MVYRITVDGVRKYAEAPIRRYSLAADNKARESIIRHFIDDEGAGEVLFDTTVEEARELHRLADEFYSLILEFDKVWAGLPQNKKWGIAEMEKLIPELMKIYMGAMKLSIPEYMEDAEYDDGEYETELFNRRSNFRKKYYVYWEVFNPYCKADLYEAPSGTGKYFDGVCQGALWDDFGGIFTELYQGVRYYRAGLVCSAIFEWRFGLTSHYGHHIHNALAAMCSAWEREADKPRRKPEDYWVKE